MLGVAETPAACGHLDHSANQEQQRDPANQTASSCAMAACGHGCTRQTNNLFGERRRLVLVLPPVATLARAISAAACRPRLGGRPADESEPLWAHPCQSLPHRRLARLPRPPPLCPPPPRSPTSARQLLDGEPVSRQGVLPPASWTPARLPVLLLLRLHRHNAISLLVIKQCFLRGIIIVLILAVRGRVDFRVELALIVQGLRIATH